MSVVKFCLLRASSSMVEQWPFKPLVESSSLSSLTSITKHPQGCFLFWLRAPSRDAFEPLLAHKHHKTSARVFSFLVESPIEGCIRASPRSQASQNIRKGVFYWLRAPSRDAFEPLFAHKHHKTSAWVFFIGWSPIEG